MLTKQIRLSLPADPENLTYTRQFVENFIDGTAFEDRSFDIQLALSEACTNVIRHAYTDKKGSSLVTLYGWMTPFTLSITIKDTGAGISTVDRKVEFPSDGGYGIALMRNLSDRFTLETTPGEGTTVNLTFCRPLIPKVIRTRRTLVVATAIVLLANLGVLGMRMMVANPSSTLYPVRLCAERTALEAPLGHKLRAEIALSFADSHLTQTQEAYIQGEYSSLDASFQPVLTDLEVVRKVYGKIPLPQRHVVFRKVQALQTRLMRISTGKMAEERVNKRPELAKLEGLLGSAVEHTGRILEVQATAGTEI